MKFPISTNHFMKTSLRNIIKIANRSVQQPNYLQSRPFHNRLNHQSWKRPKAIKRQPVKEIPTRNKEPSIIEKSATTSLFSESIVPHHVEGANYSEKVSFPIAKLDDKIPSSSLAASLLSQPALIICRKLEVLNVLLNFDQANQYVLKNPSGQDVGYLVEENTFASSLIRNLLHSRRPFHASVLDLAGNEVLKIHRPLKYFLNSKIIVTTAGENGKVIGKVESDWHLYRRKYNLFVRDEKMARIDEQILAWDFLAVDDQDRPLGLINRNFSGFLTELFTEKGQYVVHYDATPSQSRPLSLDERAVLLACAITIDIDYFSKSVSAIGIPANVPVSTDSPTGTVERESNQPPLIYSDTGIIEKEGSNGSVPFEGAFGNGKMEETEESISSSSLGKNQWGDDEFIPDEPSKAWGNDEFNNNEDSWFSMEETFSVFKNIKDIFRDD